MLPWVTELFNANEFKAQQKHTTPWVIHPDTTVMNREAILSIAAKFLFFFPAGTPNWKHSFFLFCIDTAFPKTDTAICYAQISFKVLSNSKNSFVFDGRRKAGFPLNSQFSCPFKYLSIRGHTLQFTASYLPTFLFSAQVYFCTPRSISAYPT